MIGWLTPQSLIAALVSIAFVVAALMRPRRAILAFAVLGATPPVLQLGAFSGRSVTQGLVVAEVLATVLAAVWLVKRQPRRLLLAPFDTPLLVFIGLAIASLIASLLLPDPRVIDRTSLQVSVGQIMLMLWPLAAYWASAEFLATTAQLRWLHRAIIVLALGQLLPFVLPAALNDYMAWSLTFGLFASPFALALSFSTRSIPLRLILVAIALGPLVRGVVDGKAFLYGFVLASAGVILWLRASRALAGVAAIGVALAVVLLFAGREQDMSAPFRRLVQTEQEQLSYGGRTGRGQIALDTLDIWKDAPILGVGPGNSYVYLLLRRQIGTPHNQYLNILVEFGALAFAAWCWFIGSAFLTGLRIYRRTIDPTHRVFVLAWLGSFAGIAAASVTGDYMIHSIRNGGLELFSGYYLQWVLLGGLIAVARLEHRAKVRSMASAGVEAPVVDAPPRRRRQRVPHRLGATA